MVGKEVEKEKKSQEKMMSSDDYADNRFVRLYVSSARTYTCTRKCYLTQYLIKKRKGDETESFLLILMITLSSNYLKFQLILFL